MSTLAIESTMNTPKNRCVLELPDFLELDQLGPKIANLESYYRTLDPELDFRDWFMVEYELSILYHQVMISIPPGFIPVDKPRQSKMNIDSVSFSFQKEFQS